MKSVLLILPFLFFSAAALHAETHPAQPAQKNKPAANSKKQATAQPPKDVKTGPLKPVSTPDSCNHEPEIPLPLSWRPALLY